MTSRAAASRWLVGLVLVGACQAAPAAAPEFTAEDEARIRGMFDATPGYLRAGDYATWANLYAEDAVFLPPNMKTASGRANIAAWPKTLPRIEDVAFSNVRVWGEGNVAYGTSAYTLKLEGVPADTGKQLAVFRRSPGGEWAVVAAAFSSDLRAAETPKLIAK